MDARPGRQGTGRELGEGGADTRRGTPPRGGAAAVAVGGATRREDEVGGRRRLPRNDLIGIAHDNAAIEQLADFHVTAGEGAPPRTGRDDDETRAHAHGVVAGDHALIAAAQQQIEIGGGRRHTGGAVAARVKRRLKSARKLGRKALAASAVASCRSRSSLTRRSCSVAHSRSTRPLACGEWART
jgi:hypothetical protein